MKTAIMAKQFILGMWPNISHLLSPKQHSTINESRAFPNRYEEKAAHQGRESKYTHLYTWWPRKTLSKLCSASCVAMCYVSLTFTLMLTCLPCMTMIRGYTENLVIWHIFPAATIYRCMHLSSGFHAVSLM